jgi:mannose-1-phosphate guanylyltransferase/phosphomannomutase
MNAVVLAGGRAQALGPLTADRPAALLPVANRPVIEHVLDHLARHRVSEATLVLHHCPYPVEARLGDGARAGVALRYALERSPLGTAGAARRVAARWTEPFVLAYGTALGAVDLNEALAFHRGRQAALTLVVTPAGARTAELRASPGGTVHRDGVSGATGFAFAGFAIVEPRALALVGPGERCDLVADLVPRLLDCGLAVCALPAAGPTVVIRTLADLALANRRALAGDFPGLVVPGYEVTPGIWLSRGARVHREARLVAPVLVGPNALVGRGASVEATVIGEDVIVGPRSTVRHAVLLPRTHIGPRLRVEDAVVDRDRLGRPAAGTWATVADPRLLGDTRAPLRQQPGSLAGRLAAAGVLVAGAPLWALLLFGLSVETGGRPLRGRPVLGARGRVTRLLDVGGRGPVGRLVRRLGLGRVPGLWSVVRGDLHWVGSDPRPWRGEANEASPAVDGTPPAPPGLVTLADLSPARLRRADRAALDRLYAATRSRRGDLRVVTALLRRRLTPERAPAASPAPTPIRRAARD